MPRFEVDNRNLVAVQCCSPFEGVKAAWGLHGAVFQYLYQTHRLAIGSPASARFSQIVSA